ncbi:putative nitrogen fixation protein NifT [Oceanospirillum sediminis]|uniref:Putative nitrogen fixation protein NifT n=1 Tax=Oceanospirillum sediminis TaxID=2760088 RepID=A0A839IPV5_9GAMM|nr:putative nitrogen fixation protein NifT [Oceanospirillum sediminis]MBB1486477.1 putative nitrogen fixation protein NifT [Oceanospirillum sediminis]
MANIIISKAEDGGLTFYMPKKDLEVKVISLEFEAADKWGGELKLASGQSYYIDPMAAPSLPKSLRARRLD